MAEAISEPSKICTQCSREFVPWSTGRGPKPSRCDSCYPPERREYVRRWQRGELDPTKTCQKCGAKFHRTKAKVLLCDPCRNERAAAELKLKNREAWRSFRATNPKPPCGECGVDLSAGRRKFCSRSCEQKHSRRVNSARRRTRYKAIRCENLDPVAICQRDGLEMLPLRCRHAEGASRHSAADRSRDGPCLAAGEGWHTYSR